MKQDALPAWLPGPGREAQGGCDPLRSQASREKGKQREGWRGQLQRGEEAGSQVLQQREGRRAWVTGWACASLWAAGGARPREPTGQPLTDKEVSRPRGPCHEARPAV